MGGYTEHAASNPSVLAFVRSFGDDAVLCVVHQGIDPRREDVGVAQQVGVDVELTTPPEGQVPPEVRQLPRGRGFATFA